jgi:hypothetical protein
MELGLRVHKRNDGTSSINNNAARVTKGNLALKLLNSDGVAIIFTHIAETNPTVVNVSIIGERERVREAFNAFNRVRKNKPTTTVMDKEAATKIVAHTDNNLTKEIKKETKVLSNFRDIRRGSWKHKGVVTDVIGVMVFRIPKLIGPSGSSHINKNIPKRGNNSARGALKEKLDTDTKEKTSGGLKSLPKRPEVKELKVEAQSFINKHFDSKGLFELGFIEFLKVVFETIRSGWNVGIEMLLKIIHRFLELDKNVRL